MGLDELHQWKQCLMGFDVGSLCKSDLPFPNCCVPGDVKVSSPLDREEQSVYTLTVTASDGVHTTASKVTVEVTDVNDEQPTFTQPWYSFEVAEDTQTGMLVGQISATDGDTGNNAQITYSMVSHWGREKFSLHSQSGEITLIGRLDYEEVSVVCCAQ